MGQRHGYTFEAEIARALKSLRNTYYHKLPDTHAFNPRCPSCGRDPRLILPKQPADFLVIRNGVPYLVECKSSRNALSYNIKYIRTHQIESAREWEAAGGKYYFAICRRVPYDMQVYMVPLGGLFQIMAKMTNKTMVSWEIIEMFSDAVLERNTKRKTWTGIGKVLTGKR